MPYTPKQNKLFRAAAHNPQIAKEHGLSMGKARTMASEGIKHDRSHNLGKYLHPKKPHG